MKTIYMNATWRRLLLWCLFSIIYYGALTAQENESARMHEVGLRISNFDLRNFGVVYKIQRPNNENHYMRYAFGWVISVPPSRQSVIPRATTRV